MSDALQNVLARLQGVKKTTAGHEARCPAHEDKQQSLSVAQGDDGRILLHCHAGCDVPTICGRIGLTVADLFEKRNGHSQQSRIIATYDYVDADGKELFQVCRLDPKSFRQRHKVNAEWIWKMEGVNRVLYRLPDVLRAVKEQRLIVVAEGEKDCDNLVKQGFCATCNPGGAGKWLESYTATLKGAVVVIIADKDDAGRKHGKAVAEALLPVAASVKVLEVPDGKGKDASDYFSNGGTAAELDELIERTPIFGHVEPRSRPLLDLVRYREQSDPNELLRHRYLCRGGGLLLCGPTGVGKSSFLLQALILWACGKPFFGIEPVRPLRSVLIQAENDEGDLSEMRDGILEGLEFSDAEIALVRQNVFVLQESELTGISFCQNTVRPLVKERQPLDLCAIDPALSYIGADGNSQKDVGGFLRNHLNPVLREFSCASVLAHHTNKPPSGKEKSTWQAGDFAYIGAGSAEWANWARAVMVIRSLGSHDVFELRAAKRGNRLRWVDGDGSRAFTRNIAHAADGRIYWRVADDDAVPEVGRPTKFNAMEMLQLLPAEGLTAAEWQTKADEECGIPKTSFHRYRRSLLTENRVLKSKINDRYQPIKKA